MNAKQINDALERSARGDVAAFEQLYKEMRGGVYSFAYTYFHNSFDAEDVMQTVFLKVKRNIGQYRAGSNGLAWILQITKNTALKELEKRKNSVEYLDNVKHEADSANYADVSADGELGVMALMNKVLSEEEQKIVTLHVLWGYKHREIAEILDCPTGTVTSKYKRAAEKMKKAWEDLE